MFFQAKCFQIVKMLLKYEEGNISWSKHTWHSYAFKLSWNTSMFTLYWKCFLQAGFDNFAKLTESQVVYPYLSACSSVNLSLKRFRLSCYRKTQTVWFLNRCRKAKSAGRNFVFIYEGITSKITVELLHL